MTQSKHLCHEIVLIHGLYQNSLVMKILGKRLSNRGYRVHYFEYPTLKRSLSDNISALSEYLTQINVPFSIIGHSLGCILTLYTVKKTALSQLQSVIAITPPFRGSRIVAYLANHHSGFLVGKAEEVLMPKDNDLISWDHSIPLGIIAGTQNSGPSSLLLEGLTNIIEKRSLQGDGTVYIDETQISGYTDFTTLPKSHTMILFDPELPILCDRFIRKHHF